MSRGNPDYNVPEYTFFAVDTPNSDVVAERQGFTRLDNRGRVLFFDDFRSGIHRWRLDYDNASDIPTHVYEAGRSIGFGGSLRCDPATGQTYSGIHQEFMLPVSKRMGFEFCFWAVSNFGYMTLLFSHIYNTGVYKTGIINIMQQTGAIKLFHAGGNATVVTPSNVSYFTDKWVAVKAVLDFETQTWVRLMIGNTQYDISQYALEDGNPGFVGSTICEFAVSRQDATYKQRAYLGYVVISGDEP